VLALILAVITWAANGLVTRLLATPTVVYTQYWLTPQQFASEFPDSSLIACASRDALPASEEPILVLRLRNLSNRAHLKNIGIAIGVPPNSTANVVGMRLRAKNPALRGDASDACGVRFAKLEKLTFHPNWEYTLLVRSTMEFSPNINLTSSTQGLNLVPRSMTTLLVEHQVGALVVLLVLLSALAVWYLYLLAALQNQAKEVPKWRD